MTRPLPPRPLIAPPSSSRDILHPYLEGAHHAHDEDDAEDEEDEGVGRALVPVLPVEEPVIDDLGEPAASRAAEDRWHGVAARRQHEGHDAADGDAGLGVRDDDPPMGA